MQDGENTYRLENQRGRPSRTAITFPHGGLPQAWHPRPTMTMLHLCSVDVVHLKYLYFNAADIKMSIAYRGRPGERSHKRRGLVARDGQTSRRASSASLPRQNLHLPQRSSTSSNTSKTSTRCSECCINGNDRVIPIVIPIDSHCAACCYSSMGMSVNMEFVAINEACIRASSYFFSNTLCDNLLLLRITVGTTARR